MNSSACTKSRLLNTSPFLRESVSRLDVGCSVFSPDMPKPHRRKREPLLDMCHKSTEFLEHAGEISRHAADDVRQGQQYYSQSQERFDWLALRVHVKAGSHLANNSEADIYQKQRQQSRRSQLHGNPQT